MSAAWPPPPSPATPVSACYRHPKVSAPISCNLCQRPICTNCMISAPVGWQCPSCVKGAPPVRRMRDVQSGFAIGGQMPFVTYGLIAICVAMFAVQLSSGGFEDRFVVVASEVAEGEWWRVVTSGFLHGNLIHLLFNMLLLFQLGAAVEGRLGRARFFGVYAVSLAGGSIGAMLLQDPNQGALGASGAVYGLMGAVVALSRRGRSPIESGVGGLLVVNLVFTFVFPGISIGGHLGGLAAGALAGLLVRVVGEGGDVRRVAATAAVLAVLAMGLVIAGAPVADWKVEASQSSAGTLTRSAGADLASARGPAPNLGRPQPA